MRRWVRIIAYSLLVLANSAKAETTHMLDAQRVSLRDVIPQATGMLASLDLGSAPPPGGSRLFSGDDIRTAIILAHENVGDLPIPTSVRIVRVTRKFSERELDSLIRPSLSSLLPRGVNIVGLELPKSVLTAPRVTVGEVRMPKLPKRAGLVHSSAVAELVFEGDVLVRVPFTMELKLDDQATQYLLDRGAPLNLVIDTGVTRVTAAAVVQTAADLGDIVPCQVTKTRKVLRAKIISNREAVVVQR